MKFICSGDWHFGGYPNDKIDQESNLPQRLHEIKKVVLGMIEYCRNNSIDTIVIPGDTNHNKSVIYAIAQSALLEIIRTSRDIKFIFVDGNHDLSGKGFDVVSSLLALDNEPNAIHITKPMTIENVFFVPYSVNMEESIRNNKNDFLVSHFGLSEGMLNSGISVVSKISLKDLEGKYKFVLLGHYHIAQQILTESVHLYYTGSIIQLNWGEKDEKRFLIVDTDNQDIQSIPITGYRRHVEFEINKDNQESVMAEARKLISEGHHVKLNKIENFDSVELSKEFKVVDCVDKDITNRGIKASMTMEEKLLKYLEIKEIDTSQIEEYKNFAIDVISSVGV